MTRKTIEKLCCPFDKKDLNLTVLIHDANKNVLEGVLACKHCRRIYPIIQGVPIMSPDDYREEQLEMPVMARWQLQHDLDIQKLI